MKTILAMAATMLVIGVSAIFLVGSLLPREHTATRSAEIGASPEQVFELISNIQNQPKWRTGIVAVRVLPKMDGKEHWEEQGRRGSLPFVLEESAPARRRVVRIADAKLPYGGTWTFEIAPAAKGSRLTITEAAYVNPALFRFVGRYLVGYDATIRQYLADVERAFPSPPG